MGPAVNGTQWPSVPKPCTALGRAGSQGISPCILPLSPKAMPLWEPEQVSQACPAPLSAHPSSQDWALPRCPEGAALPPPLCHPKTVSAQDPTHSMKCSLNLPLSGGDEQEGSFI